MVGVAKRTSLPLVIGLASLLSCSKASDVDTTAGGGGAPGGAQGGEGGAPAATGGGVSQSGLVLRGGSVVDPATQTIAKRDLYICGGVIVEEAAGKSCSLKEVDVAGKWLIPSLTDMHVHARGVTLGDEDFREIPIEEEAPIFRLAGVTGFLDAMNDEAKIFPIRDAQRAQGLYPGADVFCSGAAFTPSGGHGTEYGLPSTSYRIVDSVAEVMTQMSDLEGKHPDVVKIFYDHRGADGGPDVQDGEEGALGVAMRKDVMEALVAAANALQIRTEVHIGVWNDARAAIQAGATAIAHLGETAVPGDIVAMASEKGVYWIPTQSLYHGLTDIIADESLLDDPLLAKVATPEAIDSYRTGHRYVDPYTLQWLARHTHDADNVAKLHQGGVKLLAGTDVVELGTFIGWSLHRELRLFVDAGLSPWEALATATTRAGEFLGHHYGVEPGAEGSVVVLDASPIDDIWNTTRIQMVVHHGSVVPAP